MFFRRNPILKVESYKPLPIDRENEYKRYHIFTKDDYVRYRLSRMKAANISRYTILTIKEHWRQISKGYDFIIGVGQYENLMFYSVPYFNDYILGGK